MNIAGRLLAFRAIYKNFTKLRDHKLGDHCTIAMINGVSGFVDIQMENERDYLLMMWLAILEHSWRARQGFVPDRLWKVE